MNPQDDRSTNPGPRDNRSRWRKVLIVVVALLVVFILVNFGLPYVLLAIGGQPLRVVGDAMSPTLNDGDRIIISKDVDEFNRGDIVVFYNPDNTTKSFVKRIIGLPGETIQTDSNGQVNINGTPLSEPYVLDQNRMGIPIAEQTIDGGHYYMMGDNREASYDSRLYRTVDKSLVYGKVVFRYWPLGKEVK